MSEWRLTTDRPDEELCVYNNDCWIIMKMTTGDTHMSHTLKMWMKPHQAREFAQALLASAESMEQMRKAKS